MPQINLLNQSTKNTVAVSFFGKLIEGILSTALIVALLGYGALYYYTHLLGQQIAQTKQDIVTLQNSPAAKSNRTELLKRQGQLIEANNIISSHLNWSNFLTELGSSSLKGITYSSLIATADGKLKLNLAFNTYSDLDKYLQIFDDPKLAGYFYEPKVSSVSKAVGGGSVAQNTASVELKFKKDLLTVKKLDTVGSSTPTVKKTSQVQDMGPHVLGASTEVPIDVPDDDRAGVVVNGN